MNTNIHIYQINIRQYLSFHNVHTLYDLDFSLFEAIKARGFNCVWIMGVWTLPDISEIITEVSTPAMEQYYKSHLPDYTIDDVCGSLFSIDTYELEPSICGSKEQFIQFKQKLNDIGLKLMVDFVPNHMSIKSRLIKTHPDLFVSWNHSQDIDLHNHYQTRIINDRCFAYGKDPFFDPWYDTVQINWFHPHTLQYFKQTLEFISTISDGVRCDMSMLLVNSIFEKNWKSFTDYFNIKPNTHIWEDLIAHAKKNNPEFVFLGECYWDMETQLLEHGFDYVYYKKWLDFIKVKPSFNALSHFVSQIPHQLTNKAVLFIENHDEDRAARIFPDKNEFLIAQTLTQNLPYSYLENWGQKERFIFKGPVQLKRISTQKGE